MKFCGSFVKDVKAVPWYVGMNYSSCFDVIVFRVCFMVQANAAYLIVFLL
jgi:hypothetical protein